MNEKEEKKLAKEINKFSEENWKNEYKFYMNGEEIEVKFISLGMECDFKTQTNKYELEVETSGGEKVEGRSKVSVTANVSMQEVGRLTKSGDDSKLPEPISLGEYHANWLAKLEEGQATTEPEYVVKTVEEQWEYDQAIAKHWIGRINKLIEEFLSDLNNDMIKKHIIEKWRGRIK